MTACAYFFKDKTGTFMYLPPLCGRLEKDIIERSFGVMNSLNKNKTLSRIENIEEKDSSFYEKLGYEIAEEKPRIFMPAERTGGVKRQLFNRQCLAK